jgi:hypothetical protein
MSHWSWYQNLNRPLVYSFSHKSQNTFFRAHVDMNNFSWFRMRNSCPHFAHSFQLHSIYVQMLNIISTLKTRDTWWQFYTYLHSGTHVPICAVLQTDSLGVSGNGILSDHNPMYFSHRWWKWRQATVPFGLAWRSIRHKSIHFLNGNQGL